MERFTANPGGTDTGVKIEHEYLTEVCGTLSGAVENLKGMVKEQERTIQVIKSRLDYWANELEEHRWPKDPEDEEFGNRIAEMRRTAEQL